MALDIRGKLIQVLPLQSGVSKAGNEWSKQEFVIETDEQFPKKACFILFGNKVSLLAGFKVGDQVEVSFNLESREFNGKWYTDANAWKINPVQPANEKQGSAPFADYGELPPPPMDTEYEPPTSDLPF